MAEQIRVPRTYVQLGDEESPVHGRPIVYAPTGDPDAGCRMIGYATEIETTRAILEAYNAQRNAEET